MLKRVKDRRARAIGHELSNVFAHRTIRPLTDSVLADILNHMVQYSARLDDVFAALSDPTRREIITRLSVRPLTISELAAPYPMSLPAIAKHVRILEETGLLRSRKIGRVRRCALEAAPLEEAANWIAHYKAFWEHRLDALDRFLAASEEKTTIE
jgi:DNA-binding transcriptional ArsR family regulator